MGKAETWALIHGERSAIADTFESLTEEQWAAPSLCAGWSVQDAAGHILAGAEQTIASFTRRMAMNGFRFNTMIDVDAKRAGTLAPSEIVTRLRARTTTTNGPPAPVETMLGEVVVHSEDIRRALGITASPAPAAITGALDLYAKTGFPLNSKQRISGTRLIATDVEWTHGDGPEVSGTGLSLLLAMTGRSGALDALSGEGAPVLAGRIGAE